MAFVDFLRPVAGYRSLADRALVLLAGLYLRQQGSAQFSAPEIESLWVQAGVEIPEGGIQPRLAHLTRGSKPPLLRIGKGTFAMTAEGYEEIRDYLRTVGGLKGVADALARAAGQISPESEATFVAEMRLSIDAGAKRATVILMWLVTVDHLQRHVIHHKKADFNGALSKRTDLKGITIDAQSDFEEMKRERDFIDLLGSSGIVTPSVKKLLVEKLDFRNTCAHPNNITIGDAKVVSFVEDIVDNVLLRYPM